MLFQKKPYFHKTKLRFECTGCSDCCRGDPEAYAFVTEGEAEAIRNFLGLSWDWFRRRYLVTAADGGLALQLNSSYDCCFLDANGRCKIYPVRPKQCSSYPFWPELVASAAAWKTASFTCEGIGRGREWSSDEIESILATLIDDEASPCD